ncbi:hypothetical protein [Paenibacillus sp. Pae108]|uniref:hypothetical protein n=1 Tax=Paenibacillus sp. Pae108 TaxID=2926019 RepID=UPI002119A399|nr:hypothetical protein [Paenibacillus sp. Pae108]
MDKYKVTSDFYDKETGELIKAGEEFEADEERAEALRQAGVIGKKLAAIDPKEVEKAEKADKEAEEDARKAREKAAKKVEEANKKAADHDENKTNNSTTE